MEKQTENVIKWEKNAASKSEMGLINRYEC